MEAARRKTFDAAIKQKLGDSIIVPLKEEHVEYIPYKDDESDEDFHVMPGSDDTQYDLLVNLEVQLPYMDNPSNDVVIDRHCDNKDGNLVGGSDSNPILSTAHCMM